MRPLRITAHMRDRGIMPREGGVHLDSLLMAAAAKRDDIPTPLTAADWATAPAIDIPIAKSECGRYYLASALTGEVIAREVRYVQRRFPMSECIALGSASITRIATNAGAAKGFRVPVEAQYIPRLTAYAIGHQQKVRALLDIITRLGKRRAVGEGTVRKWEVEECATWPGFPVLSPEGEPMRNLPLDTPGLTGGEPRWARLAPPYHLRLDEEACACP